MELELDGCAASAVSAAVLFPVAPNNIVFNFRVYGYSISSV